MVRYEPGLHVRQGGSVGSCTKSEQVAHLGGQVWQTPVEGDESATYWEAIQEVQLVAVPAQVKHCELHVVPQTPRLRRNPG